MPRKRLPPNDPREWLRRAQSNLARAASLLPDAYLEDFCFDAQQAAEKAIKAVFMAHGLTFPYIHDLGRLLTVLAQAGVRVPQYVPAVGDATGRKALPMIPNKKAALEEGGGRARILVGKNIGGNDVWFLVATPS